MKICTIIGARPQFIKAASLSRAIALYNHHGETNRIQEVIVHTGQHYDDNMSDIFFRELEIPEPAYNLEIGSGNHGYQTGQMLAGIENILIAEQPDRVLVYGDTNSTLAGALAAAKLNLRIAHIEAGLRSFNRRMPEEINRVLTDHLSHLLLCPGKTASKNLAAEGITRGVEIVGDVMADALQYAVARTAAHHHILSHLGLQDKSYLLATIHRQENADDPERIKSILAAFDVIKEIIVFPVHPRSRKILLSMEYNPPEHVMLIEPVGYFDMIALEQSARMILTDSGGMQKEAYWLKIPCITLRDETEWVETVEGGWNILSGTDPKIIIDAVNTFSPPANHPQLYGDGNSAMLCLRAIMEADEKIFGQ